MPNHIHALIQPPEPNLARGMQHWLSGYANWYAKPNQRTGHLYQGRYNAILVEDAGYYWTLSRYIHLKSLRGLSCVPKRRSGPRHGGLAAWLCRRWSPDTLRELGPRFGLSGVDSVSNLVRRAEQRHKESSRWRQEAANIELQLHLNTEHKA